MSAGQHVGHCRPRVGSSARLLPGAPDGAVVEALEGLEPGAAADLAAGHGRHALWLARGGWAVTALERSPAALAIVRGLARARAIPLATRVADITAWSPARRYNLVLIAFVHLPQGPRRRMLRGAVRALAPGGSLVYVGISGGRSGGPADPLATPAGIAADLDGLVIRRSRSGRRPVAGPDGDFSAEVMTIHGVLADG